MSLLLVAVIGFFYLFWPQYALFWEPIYTQATILKLDSRSVEYKFYVPLQNKTLFFERTIQLHESKRLQGYTKLERISE
ncbi:hypothetical protein DDQ68_19570 [Hymenobacter nivis]|uniref:Uncharacterized protein n=1 Tax=Hymenobacter nivis TaxID=1850093 RepID=A0A2Z3GQQ8_9BACT|nr:hypothetical protein DDQ68_19570 [Hymenobacter nivis]